MDKKGSKEEKVVIMWAFLAVKLAWIVQSDKETTKVKSAEKNAW